MKTFYESSRFCVMQFMDSLSPLPIGLDIIDKASARECYISGPGAETFFRKMKKLAEYAISTEEIDDILGEYSVLLNQPTTLQ